MNLVEWLKLMVASRRAEEVVDPSLEEKPATRALKRALLISLRCVDPDSEKRPKMGQVVRMLEADEVPYREVAFSYSIHNVLYLFSVLFHSNFFEIVTETLYLLNKKDRRTRRGQIGSMDIESLRENSGSVDLDNKVGASDSEGRTSQRFQA